MANYTIQLEDLGGNSLFPLVSKDSFNEVLPIEKGGTGVGTEEALKELLSIEGKKPILVWKNSSPTSNFGEQTITLTDSTRDIIVIRFRWSTTNNNGAAPLVCIKGAGQNGASAHDASNRVMRYTTYNADGTVTFSNGLYNGSNNDIANIPTEIWGI